MNMNPLRYLLLVMKRFPRKFCWLALAVLLSACHSVPPEAVRVQSYQEIPSLPEREKERLNRLSPGMPFADFEQIFPEAFRVAMDERTFAYELAHVITYATRHHSTDPLSSLLTGPDVHTHRQVLWFYFVEDTLIKWGNPRDWPSPREIQRFF